MAFRVTSVFVICGLLCGCASRMPEYQLADIHSDEQWHTELGSSQSTSAEWVDWWKQFHDQTLDQLVALTVANNTDIQTARLTYRQSELGRRFARSELGPEASAGFGGSNSANDGEPTLYDASLNVSWELDLWGTGRSMKSAALADLLSSRESLHYSLVSLVAETATAYSELRTAQQNLAVVKHNLDIQQQTYDFVKWQQEAGISSVLDVTQARTTLEQTRASMPEYKDAVNQAMNRLRVLTGGDLSSVSKELQQYAALPVLPQNIAVGIPADTLRQRPDVKAKEYAVRAVAESVYQAKNQYLPSFTLTGSLTNSAMNISDLFSINNFVATLAGSLSETLFDGGSRKLAVKTSEIELQQSLVDYRASLLNAQEEVENALSALKAALDKDRSLKVARDSAEEAFRLADMRYESGLVDFSTVLDAQTTLLTAENSYTSNQGQMMSSWVQLYAVLGGGWQNIAGDEQVIIEDDVQ